MPFSLHKNSIDFKAYAFPRHLFNSEFETALKVYVPTAIITQKTEPDALNYDFLVENVPALKAAEFKRWIKNYANTGRL